MLCVCLSSCMHVFIHYSSVKGARSFLWGQRWYEAGTELKLGAFMKVHTDGNVVADLFKCPDIWVCY